MKAALLVLLGILCCGLPAMADRGGWAQVPGIVAEALLAFRQTEHALARAINENLDGEVLGRLAPRGHLPMNFDATRHLAWTLLDLNQDGRPEVFLLFPWTSLDGNNEVSMGVLLVDDGRGRWRTACDIEAKQRLDSFEPVRVLAARHRGWHEFAIRNERHRVMRYAWRRENGRMVCAGQW